MMNDAYNYLFSFLIPKEESNQNDIEDKEKDEDGNGETDIKSLKQYEFQTTEIIHLMELKEHITDITLVANFI